MPDLKALYEERGKLEKQMRELVDKADEEKRDLSAEEDGQFNEMHERDVSLKRQIERQQVLEQIGKENGELRDHGIDRRQFPASAAGDPPKDEREEPITDEEQGLAIRAWARRQFGIPLSKRDKAACRKYQRQVNRRFHPDRRDLVLPLAATEQVRALQADYRNNHPSAIFRNVTTGAAPSGDPLIPTGFVNRLEQAQLAFGGMLQVAEIIVTDGGGDLPWPTANDTGNTGAWLSEATSIGSSVDPTFGSLTLQAHKASSKLVKVSPEIIEDSAFDLPNTLGGMLGERLGRIQNTGFTTGDNSGKPNGIMNAATLGVTAALSTGIAFEELMDLEHSVDPAYRRQAGYMMHDGTVKAVRKLKDSDGRFLWSNGTQFGRPDTLNGYSVTINQDMDSIDDVGDTTDAGEKIILFGQLNKYKVRRVRAVRLRRLVERFADEDLEGFVAFIRVDGDLLDAGTAPVKYLQLSN